MKTTFSTTLILFLIALKRIESFSSYRGPTQTKQKNSIQLQHVHHKQYSTKSLFSAGVDVDADADIDDADQDDSLECSYDDSDAQSQFGTKSYWDDMYSGMGDFSSEEYSWYFGWGEIKSYFMEYAPQPIKKQKSKRSNNDNVNERKEEPKILVPGIGNDGILLDLYNYGYKDITAFDYSQSAIDRQLDLISYNSQAADDITLKVRDARKLDLEWDGNFDMIFEKGALDAVYLSGDGYVELAVKELTRVIKVGGIFISVSGVVPEELRREMFSTDDWEWIRDGSMDLKAGCFVWKRK